MCRKKMAASAKACSRFCHIAKAAYIEDSRDAHSESAFFDDTKQSNFYGTKQVSSVQCRTHFAVSEFCILYNTSMFASDSSLTE